MKLPLIFAVAATTVLAPVTAIAADEPRTVNARNTQKAATMEVEDPNTLICVRVPITGSRTRTRKDCRTQAAWQSHLQEVAATRRGMNESR